MADELKPYQVEAVREAVAALETHRSVLLVLATGLGKTVIFCTVAKRFAPERNVLVLAHREELIDQAGHRRSDLTSVGGLALSARELGEL